MRRRLLNQTEGDPAAEAIAARDAQVLNDVVRFGRQQPEIVSRRDRERVTEYVRDIVEAGAPPRRRNGGTGAEGFQGPGSGMSSQAGALPPSPPAPRPKLRLKRLGEE